MQPFAAASHEEILLLIVRIALLLFSARAVAEVAQRLGQPAVVGELLAGIILGPSLLSGAFPALGAWIVPQTETSGQLLEAVSLIGAMFLLLITGLEIDVVLIRRHARSAIGASLGGIVVPFLSGFLLGQFIPDHLLVDPKQRLIFSLFIATALSISAIPVIAKVLMDMNLMRRDVGQTILAAGMTDDAVGWILLSVVLGIASGAAVTIFTVLGAVAKVAGFMLFSFTAGRWLVKHLLDFVQDEVVSSDRLLTLVVVLAFAWGALTQTLGLEAVFGVFVMGILLGTMPRLPEAVHQTLGSVALGIFTPIFFAVAGLKVHVQPLLEPALFGIALLVIGVATFGKVLGGYAGGRLLGRRDHWTSLAFGVGMNARGAMEIIIATIGLHFGILGPEMFSVIVLMAMVTSLMTPPALRWALRHVVPEQQELDRLRQEELTAGSMIAKIHRVLIPVRRRPSNDHVQRIQAFLIEKMGERARLALTLFNVAEVGGRTKSAEFLDRLRTRFPEADVTLKIVEAEEASPAILDEAQKNYHLMILGAPERNERSAALFHPLVDEMVRLAPCPTLVVSGAIAEEHWPPKRILVPTNGSLASRHAAEIGFALVGRSDEEVVLLNVVRGKARRFILGGRATAEWRALDTGRQLVVGLQKLGEAQGAGARALVEVGDDPDVVILELARREQVGLIILGTDVRPASDRLFLGPRVERILAGAPCAVVVVNAS